MKQAVLMSLLMAVVLCSVAVSAISAPEGEVWRTESEFWHKAVQADYRTLNISKKTTLPVYAAPGEGSFRGAKGKASVSLSEPIRILGETGDHNWQMIEYDVSKDACRVGWIKLSDKAKKPELSEISVNASMGRLTADAVLTDDPRGSGRVLCSLPAGEMIAVLFKTGTNANSMLYVKTEIDGKKAAGFLSDEFCEPIQMYEIEGDTIIVTEGVEYLGSLMGWWDFGDDGMEDPIWRGEDQATVFGQISLSLDANEDADWDADYYPLMETTKVLLPDTLRGIGSSALFGIRAEELAIPEGVKRLKDPDTFYSASIGILRIPASLTELDIHMAFTYTPVSYFEVAENNPVYSSRDGVLFSRDGKTLVAYPSGLNDSHYDVPAGTEIIGANAFRDDRGALPLVTLSLPIGLRKIESYAFAECGNLISLAVPPTVKSLAENAFAYCVSLQRLSLPMGLTAVYDNNWVIRDDTSLYNGDNGPTLTVPRQTDEEEDE